MIESDISKICLASHSPRRRGLLESLGVSFFVQAAEDAVEQQIPGAGKGAQAEEIALLRAAVKGRDVQTRLPADCSILSADTVVHLGERLLDKPASREQAMEFLRILSGREHGVVTAVWLSHRGKEYTIWRRTWVEFARLSESMMSKYVETGDPFDKAGGYGIQGVGGALVREIKGCYFNVMGLPLHDTAELFTKVGLPWRLSGSN